MKQKKEYLTEENYENSKKKLKKIGNLVLVVGLGLALILIVIGIINVVGINSMYSEENIQKQIDELTVKANEEEERLNELKERLERQIAPVVEQINDLERTKFDGFTDEYYERQDKIEELQKSIEDEQSQINEIENYHYFSGCNFITVTKDLCELDAQIVELETMDPSFEKSFNSKSYIPFFIFGGFIIFATLIAYMYIKFITKGREILAFSAQQAMPIAQEGMEKIAPSVGKAGKTIAKEISKGIKEEVKDEKE